MDAEQIKWIFYSMPVCLVLTFWLFRKAREGSRKRALAEQLSAGADEPASLHPYIELHKCLGCGSCVSACPEGNVLGVIEGKSQLINPSHCIGHGACKAACPVDAIKLVFGTATRGVDIPMVQPSFETNVPGIFIAGELGGMGLIRNAVEQGRQAMESIIKRGRGKAEFDVAIIGAGPAGFSASLAAHDKGLKYLTLEQESLGGTVFHFPRGKIVMTQPMNLPTIGKIRIRETSKEALLEFWQDVERKSGVRIRYNERMESIDPCPEGYRITTNRGSYTVHSILLSIGRRGSPRKLDVPGEELSKVVYRLTDPEQYRQQKVLVVGGGDSALEAATSIADVPGTTVTLSYRGDSFSRAKEKNRQRVETAQQNGRLQVLLNSNVREIFPDRVTIDHAGELVEIRNDAVIISAGGVLPTPMLKKLGIHVETKFGTE